MKKRMCCNWQGERTGSLKFWGRTDLPGFSFTLKFAKPLLGVHSPLIRKERCRVEEGR